MLGPDIFAGPYFLLYFKGVEILENEVGGKDIEDSSGLNLTRKELIEMERKTKTDNEVKLDYIITLFPVLAGILHLIEYYYMPNYQNNSNTHVYGIVIGIFTVYLLLNFLMSLRNKDAHLKLRKKAPFKTVLLLVLMLYDILTLKTNTLVLPFFPWIDRIMNSAIGDSSYLLESLLNSIILLFKGYLIGVGLGVITGILCGYSEKVNYWISPILKVIGPIPSTTWLPIVMVLFSSLHNGAVFIISLGVWFSVSLATINGIRNIDKSYFDAAKTLGDKDRQLITRVAIPAAMPNIFQGMTQGMSAACTALIVAEMLGVESGLGWYINWQKSWAEYGKMYAAIILICLLFLTVNWILDKVNKRVLVWKEGRVN